MGSQANYKDYISSLKPIWCPGCGDFAVLTALAKALHELRLPTEKTAIVSGIGCSSRLPGYLNTYGFNATHGRAIPIACGLKISRPDITVIAAGGDGDAFAIGGGHLAHAARRNVDITYIVMDNDIYGLTKGQASPTTPAGDWTLSTPYGNIEDPVKPLRLMLGYGASFIAQSASTDPRHLTYMILAGIRHPGFAFINVLSPCVTYRGMDTYQKIKQNGLYMEKHDASDIDAAWKLTSILDKYPLGIIYASLRETYGDRVKKVQEKAAEGKQPSLEDEMALFLP